MMFLYKQFTEPTKLELYYSTINSPDDHSQWRSVDYMGLLHSFDDQPAIIQNNGTKRWYQHGKLDRGNDLPAVVRMNGIVEWYRNDKRHRSNGPAVTHPTGSEWWFRHGKLHREGGPAIIESDGPLEEWWINGKHIKTS